MWMAMERSAQDMELSCDETVLLEADDVTRRRYAGLLLATAGDSRGFTTCLSASASALRYRLRNVSIPSAAPAELWWPGRSCSPHHDLRLHVSGL